MKKYNLLVPMAGKGQRFVDAGYNVPKQFIYAGFKQLIDISLDSFDRTDCNLIFVVRDDQISNYGVDKILKTKYGEDIKIAVTNGLTQGSVSSCLYAEEYINNDLPLFIHTLDIEFFPKIVPEEVCSTNLDGLIYTFKSNSPNYSYILKNEEEFVTKTTEKKVISNEACVGIYYFKTGTLFCENAKEMINKVLKTNDEYYITPLYNLLIEKNLKVKTKEVEKIHIFGTPAEFEFYKNNVIKKIGDKPIALCSDHSGFDTKQLFKKILKNKNISFIDYGTVHKNDCDYKYFIEQAVAAKKDGVCDYIFGFCRTGQGVNMCANKFENIRSALIYDFYSAEMAIRHNCANFFSFPSKIYTEEKLVEEVCNILLNNSFDGGRHQKRVQELISENF